MAITLTYGRKVPEVGDRGVPLFQDLEDNIIRDDSHNHDGVNSPLLTSQSFVGITDTLLAANWVAVVGLIGHYRQLVTIHPGFLFDTSKLSFRTPAGAYIYPTVERVTNLTYFVYTTDNTSNMLVMHGG